MQAFNHPVGRRMIAGCTNAVDAKLPEERTKKTALKLCPSINSNGGTNAVAGNPTILKCISDGLYLNVWYKIHFGPAAELINHGEEIFEATRRRKWTNDIQMHVCKSAFLQKERP